MSTNPKHHPPIPEIDDSLPDGAADRSQNQRDQASPQPVAAAESIAAQPGHSGNDPSHKVGKGRPPLHSRFKSGNSGNPKGRRKGSKNEATLLTELLDKTKVTLRESGKSRKITAREAIYRNILQDALKGDLKAARFIFERHAAVEAGGAGPGQLTAEEKEIIDAHLKRLASERAKEAA
jgi:hypothetical protein